MVPEFLLNPVCSSWEHELGCIHLSWSVPPLHFLLGAMGSFQKDVFTLSLLLLIVGEIVFGELPDSRYWHYHGVSVSCSGTGYVARSNWPLTVGRQLLYIMINEYLYCKINIIQIKVKPEWTAWIKQDTVTQFHDLLLHSDFLFLCGPRP